MKHDRILAQLVAVSNIVNALMDQIEEDAKQSAPPAALEPETPLVARRAVFGSTSPASQ